MKFFFTAFILIICSCNSICSQKIQYSRGTFPIVDEDEMQLVSNINGYHHLLRFSYNKKPSIYIFNSQLQLGEKRQMDFAIKKDCDVKLVSFPDHYFVYMHVFKPSSHGIWKVDEQGNVISLSGKFNKVVDSFFRNYAVSLQLDNLDGKLYLTSHTYFDTIKTVRSTIVQVDEQMNLLSAVKILYPFDRDKEFLHQATLTANALFVLKSSRDNQQGNTLDIMKVDLATKNVVTYSFNSGFGVYLNPAFNLNPADSSLLVYSMVMKGSQKTVLISRLNNELQEQLPTVILKSQFRQNTLSNFIFANSSWLNIYGNKRILRVPNRGNRYTDSFGTVNREGSSYYVDYSNYNQSTAVRLTLLDRQLELKTDSLIENNKKIIEVPPYPFGRFVIKDKGYLVLTQNFTVKKKGLLLLSPGNKELSVTPLPVYDRYDYLLSQLQFTGENYFIVPFVSKMEMGLMKVKMDEYDQLSLKNK